MYEEVQAHISNEIYQATASYVIWKHLQNEPARDEGLLRAFNRAPLAWIVFRYSAMQTLILTLGRLFDTNGDSISVDDLLRSCIDEISLFSVESLRQRKSQIPGSEEWIKEYMADAVAPRVIDFQRLKPQVKKHRDIYNEYYRPLRHKIYAHSDKFTLGSTDELWQATKNANMEDMLNFLEDLNSAIVHCYDNGGIPKLTTRTYDHHWFSRDIKIYWRP